MVGGEADMARTEHLPIYKASYDLCLYLEQVVHGFSRYHKYTPARDVPLLRGAAHGGDCRLSGG
jgi:hypothetical protein